MFGSGGAGGDGLMCKPRWRETYPDMPRPKLCLVDGPKLNYVHLVLSSAPNISPPSPSRGQWGWLCGKGWCDRHMVIWWTNCQRTRRFPLHTVHIQPKLLDFIENLVQYLGLYPLLVQYAALEVLTILSDFVVEGGRRGSPVLFALVVGL